MSNLPLRVRFGLVVVAIVTVVIGALGWLALRVFERQPGATLWFSLSGVLVVTLLVDQVAHRLIYRRLAGIRDTMQRALKKLPDHYRLVAVLRYWNDLSYQEIEEATGLSESAVKTRLHRARKMIEDALEQQGGTE